MPVTFSRHDVMFLAELVTAGAIAADDDDVSDAGKDDAEAISSTSFSQWPSLFTRQFHSLLISVMHTVTHLSWLNNNNND